MLSREVNRIFHWGDFFWNEIQHKKPSYKNLNPVQGLFLFMLKVVQKLVRTF